MIVRVLLRALALVLLTTLSGMAQDTGASDDGGSGSAPPGTWFPVEVLNEGLGPVPEWVDRDSPQAAIESFLDAIDRDDPAAAAHMLNLNGLDADMQATIGPLRASRLASVLERRALINFRALLERPDGLNAEQSSSAAMAGTARRSLLIGVLADGDREAAIRIARVKPANGVPVWVFSESTVRHINGLYERYGPSRLDRAMPPWLQTETLLGMNLFETLGLPLVLILAGFAGVWTYRGFRHLSDRAEGWLARAALRAVRWPIVIVVTTTVVLFFALRVFTVSGPVASILTPMVLVGYVIAVMIFALSLLDTAIERIVTVDADKLSNPDHSKTRAYATLMTAGRRAMIVLAVVIGTGIVLSSANMFRSLGFSLLASAGAVTLIIGFAARHVLGNILASLQIAINRSARIGDLLIYEGYYCTVERIHFTYVQLKNWNGNRIVVPVAHFMSDSFENWSLVDGGMVCDAKFTLHQKADIEALRHRFFDLCKEHEEVTVDEDCKVLVLSQDAFGTVARFQFRVENPNLTWETECEMREKILLAAQQIEEETGKQMLPETALDDMAG